VVNAIVTILDISYYKYALLPRLSNLSTMKIPSHLQERTNDPLLELQSKLGKDAANQFISIRSAVYYRDNDIPGINPQVVIRPVSPYTDEA
jgi:hypothetical protein